MRWVRVCAVVLTLSGCVAPLAPEAVSYGVTNDGWLHQGVALPDRGEGYVRARPGESTRYGLPRLIEVLERASAEVATQFPGGEPLRIGDLSSPLGGAHYRHASHRTGRDADIVFYALNAAGDPVEGRGWVAYDRFGVGRESEEHGGDLYFFDEARNWHFLRTLLLDESAEVQWVFVSRGVKARLLRYGAIHEPSKEVLFRAAWVLQQPSSGSPHADHFHVRIGCGARQRALGCRDRGPIWPWFGDQGEKLAAPGGEDLGDAATVSALLEGELERDVFADAD